jgi:serine/threonine protein kinase
MEIYLKLNPIGQGSSGIIFMVEYINFMDSKKKYIVKIIPEEEELENELTTYLKIMRTKGIYTKNIPEIFVIPTAAIKNYTDAMMTRKRPKYSLLMEYLHADLETGLCKNGNISSLSNIYSCSPTIKFNVIYPEIVSLVKTIASLNNHGFYHNDIKLENILISNNKLFLADFGLTFKLRKNAVLSYGYGIFPNEIIYNYSINTLRLQGHGHAQIKYSDFLRKYIRTLEAIKFDQIYSKIFGPYEYSLYLNIMKELPYISTETQPPASFINKYMDNIDSFGLGVILLFMYSFTGNSDSAASCIKTKCKDKNVNTYHKVVRLLLCQDVLTQISPSQAYIMLANNT